MIGAAWSQDDGAVVSFEMSVEELMDILCGLYESQQPQESVVVEYGGDNECFCPTPYSSCICNYGPDELPGW